MLKMKIRIVASAWVLYQRERCGIHLLPKHTPWKGAESAKLVRRVLLELLHDPHRPGSTLQAINEKHGRHLSQTAPTPMT